MSFPPGTEMFQFPGFASNPYEFRIRYLHMTDRMEVRARARTTIRKVEGGFPHSEIPGSKLVRSSPRLIAAYHVLHRLSAPRHPPDALTTLDYSHDPCPLGSAQDRQRKTCLLDFSKRHVLLAKHIRRTWLRARAGSQELGVPLAEYAASLRFQTSAPLTQRGGHEPHLTFRRRSLVEPVGIEPTT